MQGEQFLFDRETRIAIKILLSAFCVPGTIQNDFSPSKNSVKEINYFDFYLINEKKKLERLRTCPRSYKNPES